MNDAIENLCRLPFDCRKVSTKNLEKRPKYCQRALVFVQRCVERERFSAESTVGRVRGERSFVKIPLVSASSYPGSVSFRSLFSCFIYFGGPCL